ncbi:MAG: T9SS type A sorting domain-containing protein [Bacteroidia bacterium]|nr:T9SS type A sorting domain-containing protein [Bacteroidia bacterium]
MKKLLSLFFITITQLSFAQQGGLHLQWHKDANGQFFKNVNDTVYLPVKIANNSNHNGVAAINLNTEQWSYLPAAGPFSFSLTVSPKIFMKNTNEGVCTDGGYARYKTTDKWLTSSSITPSVTLLTVTSAGYIGHSNNSGTYTAVYSADAITWSNLYTTTLVPQFAQTKNKIFTVNNGTLMASSNGGASFSVLNSTVAIQGSQVYSPNNDTLFLHSNQWMQSFDGGISWTSVAMPSTAVTQIACKNGKEIMMLEGLATTKKIHYSNNSGASWTTYTTVNTFYSGENLMASQTGFYLLPGYKSIDGDSWKAFLASSPAPKPYDLSHTGDIVLAGYAQGYFGYSTNKGHNFTFPSTKISASNDIMSVKAVDINKFIASDRKGQIYVSTNQGQTWAQKITSTFNNIPRKICVSNDKSVIVVTAVGSAYMSGDGANTFSFLNTTTGSGHFQSIKPVSNKIVDVAPLYSAPSFTLTGFEFYDINSSNARTLTGTVSINVAQDIVDVHMINDNVGYLLTRNPTNNETLIYKTTDGWVSSNYLSSISTPTTGIRTYDPKYGILQNFGTDTLILSGSGNPNNNQTNYYHISYDAGLTWNINYTNFSFPSNSFWNEVYKMIFFSPTQYMSLLSNTQGGSIAASAGVYINTSGLGNTSSVGIKEFYQTTFANQLLVYPNPTSDNLFLSTDAVKLNNFTIKIYDLYGQVVESTMSSSIDESIDVSNLKNGVYFIQLTLNEKTYTAKFVKR